ncbi:hypothetical protein SNEBB_009257 [Seison nebaliae]|nr:hypothetical protein SNEBB_009257 [Seison nebaliae]
MPSWKNVGEIKEQMFKCCVNNSIEDFRLLLQNYVNFLDKNSENFIPFDTMNDEGLSFLQVACQSGSFEIVSVLLNEMEKVMETLYDLIYEFITNENEMSNNRLDIPHNDNRLVLSRNNSISSNRNIIRSNLNVSKKTTETSSLYLSKNEKTKNIFRRMFFQQIINKQHSLTRRTSLHYAIFSSKRNEEIIEKLLNFYGNCRLQDLTGNTPLHLLCKDKNNPHLKKEAIQKIFHMFSSTDMSQTTENSMVLNRKELILKNSIISNYNSVIKQMSNIYSYLSFREDDQLYTPFNLFEIKNKDDDNIFCTAVKFNNIQIINLILQKIVNEISFPSTTNHQEFTETNSDDTTPIIPHVIQDIRQRMATKKRREISSIREKWRYANTVISGWKNKQLFTFLHRLSFLERAHHQNFLTIDLYIYLLYNNRLNTIFTILDKFSFRFNELIVQNDIDIKSFPNIGKVIKKNSSQDLFEDANGLKQFFSISETVPRGKGKKKNFYKFFEKSSSKINGSILPTKINDDVDDTDDDNIAIEINTLNDVLSGRNSSIINQLHENKKETYSNFHYSMISGMNMNDLRTVHDSLTNHLKLAAIFDPQDKTATQRQLMSSMMVTCFDTYWCLQGQCQMKKKDYSHQSIMNGLEAIAPLISLSEWQFLCINIFLFDALYVQQIYRSEYLFQNNILDVKFPSSLSIDNKSIGEKKKSKTISFRLKSRKKWKRKSIRLNLVRSFNCLHSYPSTIASTRDCHRTKNIIKNCLIRSVIIWLNTTSESVDIRKTIMDALHLAKLYDAEKVFASISLSR